MKKVCKKIGSILKVVFGYGIMISLFAGGLTFFGYLAALIIGGDTAAQICHVIYKGITQWIIRLSTVMVVLGLVAMYFSGELALTAKKRNEK